MSFSDQMDNDLDCFFNPNDFPELITLGGVSIYAHVDYDESLDQTAGGVMSWGTITINRADITGDAEAQYRKAVIIDSVTWYVRDVEEGDKRTWRLRIYRDERLGPR